MVDLSPNGRGFLVGSFIDRYGAECSIQKSSIAFEDCIWLGRNNETTDPLGQKCGARMHLTREMVADIIPLLERFVETGKL